MLDIRRPLAGAVIAAITENGKNRALSPLQAG